MTRRTWGTTALALGIAVSGAVAGTATSEQAVAAPTARGGTVATCTLDQLELYTERRDHSAGTVVQHYRLANTGNEACTVGGFPTYRFRGRHGPLGFASVPDPAAPTGPVVLAADGDVTSVLSWVAPGSVPAAQCHPRTSRKVFTRLGGVDGYFYGPLHARVCTTKKYRPLAGHLTLT